MRAYRWLAVLPGLGLLAGAVVANRVRPFVLGLPFFLAWIVGWVVATSGIMGAIFLLDRRHDARGAAPEGDAAPPR